VPPTGVPPAATPGPGGNGGTGFLAVLEGNVWEEGDTFRPLAGTKVRYTSEGVSVDVLTDKKGFFRLVNIGPDPGTLDLADSDWQSGTGGVIVKPPLGQTLRINLAALPKGKSAASKVTLASSASAASASAGQIVTFTFKVTNGTASAVSGLTLGDQLPDGFTLAGVTISRGDVIGRFPQHRLRLRSDGVHLAVGLIHGHHGRFVDGDALPALIDERIRGSEIDREIRGKHPDQ